MLLPKLLSFHDICAQKMGNHISKLAWPRLIFSYVCALNIMEAEKFWKEHVEVTEPLRLDLLSFSLERNSAEDHCEERTVEFNGDELESLCRSIQCTPQAIFQAAWASALSAYSGTIVTLGLVVSGRSLPIDNIEGVIGPTFNTIPASFNVGAAPSWDSLIKDVYHFNSSSLQFHHTPLRLIHKWLHRTSRASGYYKMLATACINVYRYLRRR